MRKFQDFCVRTGVGGYSCSISFNHDPLHLEDGSSFTSGTLLILPLPYVTDTVGAPPMPLGTHLYAQKLPPANTCNSFPKSWKAWVPADTAATSATPRAQLLPQGIFGGLMKVGLNLNSRSNHENYHFPNLINAKTYSASYTQPQSSEARSKVEAISLSIHSFKTICIDHLLCAGNVMGTGNTTVNTRTLTPVLSR